MTRELLAAPTIGRPPGPAHDVDLSALAADLRAADVEAEIRFDAGSRAAYSTDASNYRMVPLGVVVPRSVEAVPAIIEVCRRHGAPIVSRGGGTSLAGQCTNTAVVLDWSKYCHHVLEVDPGARTCLVEPGIVLDALNEHLRPTGLEFGPRPATHDHCTLGGMLGNNSCGATAQRSGKVVDNVVALEVLLYDGTRMWVGETSDAEYERIQRAGGRPAEIYRQLRALRDTYLSQLRTGFPQIPRRVSGYNLDSLLPEKSFHVAQALVGSEGTLVTILRARLKLVPTLPAATMVFLAYPSIADAADAVPSILPHSPAVLEGIDDTLIHFERLKHLNETGIGELPKGGAWLMVQLGGESKAEADAAADDLLRSLGRRRGDGSVHIFEDTVGERRMWDIREAGLGSTARVPGLPDTWPGWEDSAVAPDRLGDYLRDLTRLFAEHGLERVSVYGHFGQGCVHCRIPFDLYTGEGVRRFRSFMEDAADLVISYGGSLSGEHGDGQARAELLTRMFGPELTRAFGQFKAIFDPDDRMNPGKVTPPYALDEHLRIGAAYHHDAGQTHFGYPDDDRSFGRAVLRCVGVGKCRRENGGVMCPSYMVTREEKHSTRGRSRLLFEMLDGAARGGTVADGWRSEAVHEALDLCLACKGCKSDCPVNVDMATYKAEFLAHHYQGRLRPASHYAMGWLPLWATLASAAPGAVNALAQAPGINRLAKKLGGIDMRRDIPLFAHETFQAWFARRPPGSDGRHGEVLLWPDTFTNHFQPSIAQAAVEVLESAGWRVTVPAGPVCCGLTWISTGQLGVARTVLRRTITILRPYLDTGVTVVGLEPSCTAVLRSDARDLFPDDPDVSRLRDQTRTLAELLNDRTPDWRPPGLSGKAIVQTHCHQHAILGTDADAAVLARIGVDATFLDSGCCGLAGNFGFEQGHYEVSEACAERVLLPAVRDAPAETVVLADGFSCRTQIAQGNANGREAMHLAELLRAGLGPASPTPRPERWWARCPQPPSRRARLGALAAVAGGLAGVGGMVAYAATRRPTRRR